MWASEKEEATSEIASKIFFFWYKEKFHDEKNKINASIKRVFEISSYCTHITQLNIIEVVARLCLHVFFSNEQS